MNWTPNEREIAAVLELAAIKRYSYWVKKTADEQKTWSLCKENGWALAADDEGHELVPVWPHPLYAQLCAEGVWSGYEPKAISIDAWLDQWISGMERDRRQVAVFPTPNDKGIRLEPRRIAQDIRVELSLYE